MSQDEAMRGILLRNHANELGFPVAQRGELTYQAKFAKEYEAHDFRAFARQFGVPCEPYYSRGKWFVRVEI